MCECQMKYIYNPGAFHVKTIRICQCTFETQLVTQKFYTRITIVKSDGTDRPNIICDLTNIFLKIS